MANRSERVADKEEGEYTVLGLAVKSEGYGPIKLSGMDLADLADKK